ncbi:MAG: hypothetical protein ACRDT2_16165, partial [Natronosporangium sp.]
AGTAPPPAPAAATAPAARGHAAAPVPSFWRRPVLVGEVRGFEKRQEGSGYQGREVWSFRLERFDPTGNRQPPLPVFIRAKRFTGVLGEGQQVQILRYRFKGGTVHPTRLRNRTTGATIRIGDDQWATALAMLAVAGLVVLCAIVVTG